MLPGTADRAPGYRPPRGPHRVDSARTLRDSHAVAARAGRPPSGAARPRSTTSSSSSPTSSSSQATAASPTITPSSPARRSTTASPVMVVGHQKGSDTKQKIYRNFGYARPEGYRKALRAMQLAEKFSPADHLLRRHAGGVSGHRVGGARRRRSHRAQPARDDDARRAHHRRRPRRRRQRRRAGHRRRRPHPDARVRDLQRDPARRAARRSCGATPTGRSRPPRRSRSRRPTC